MIFKKVYFVALFSITTVHVQSQVIDSIRAKLKFEWDRSPSPPINSRARGYFDSLWARQLMELPGASWRDNERLSPMPPDRELIEHIKKESLRYKMTLHPAYRNVDSLMDADPKWRTNFEMNPLLPLAPWLAGYRYEPEFWINRMLFNPLRDKGNTYITNMFVVTKRERFIRHSDTVPPPPKHYFEMTIENLVEYDIYGYASRDSKYPDTLYYEVSGKYFPFDDRRFSVYYCQKTGDMRLIGGNIWIEPIPCAWQDATHIRGGPRKPTRTFSYLKTNHAYTEDITQSDVDERKFFDIQPLYVKKEYDTTTMQSRWSEGPQTHNIFLGFKYHRPSGIIFAPTNCQEQRIFMIRFVAQYDFLTDFERQAAVRHRIKENFAAYLVKYMFDTDAPQTYDDILPIVRGMTEQEVNILAEAGLEEMIYGRNKRR